jgi:hypothetical protein
VDKQRSETEMVATAVTEMSSTRGSQKWPEVPACSRSD